MIVRRPLFVSVVIAMVAAAVAVGCVPPGQSGPPSGDPLPEAPRMRFPSALPEGAIAIVAHRTPTGHITDYVVDADSARPWDHADVEDRRLMARAFGWLSSTGVELQPRGDGQLARCAEFEGTVCEDVPHLVYAANRGFSPDGTRFAVIDDPVGDPVLRVYDTATLDVVVETAISDHAGPNPPVWSPDSSSLLVVVPVDGSNISFAGSLATLAVAPGAEPVVLVEGGDDDLAAVPLGWSDDGRLSYLWLRFLAPDVPEYTIRSRPALGSGPERILGETYQMSFNAALRDGSVIAAPPLDEHAGGEVPHLFGPAAGTVTPLARPVLGLDGGDELNGSVTRIIGIVEP